LKVSFLLIFNSKCFIDVLEIQIIKGSSKRNGCYLINWKVQIESIINIKN